MAVAWVAVAVGVAPLSWARGAHAEQPRLEIRTPAVRPGEDIAVVHSVLPVVDTHAWIGFYEKAADRDENYLRYTFLANLTDRVYDVTAPQKIGTEYHFRLFLTKGYVCAARSSPVEVSLTTRVRLPPASSPTQAPPSQPIPEPPPHTPPDVQPGGAPVVPEAPPSSASGDSMRVAITDWIRVDLPPSSGPQTVSHGEALKVTFPTSALGEGGRASIGRVTEVPSGIYGDFKVFELYEVSLHGHRTFTEDVILEFRYDPAQFDPALRPEDQVLTVRWDTELQAWIELPATSDAERQLIIVRTPHLSVLGYLGAAAVAAVVYMATPEPVMSGIREGVGSQLKRIRHHIRTTHNFQLYYTETLTRKPWTSPRATKAEDVEQEYRYLWQMSDTYPDWTPYIRDCAYFLEKSLAAYRARGWNPVINRFTFDPGQVVKAWPSRVGLYPVADRSIFEIGPGKGGGLLGATNPGGYDYTIRRAYINSDHKDCASRGKLQHALAHELFHSVQLCQFPDDPGKGIDKKGLWWIEATAEYAAAVIAWDQREKMGRGAIYPLHLEFPLTYSGSPKAGISALEYGTGFFVDFLVDKGASFEHMHKEVLADYVSGKDALIALEDYLRVSGPAPLPVLFREYAAWFLLGGRSPFTSTYTDPLGFPERPKVVVISEGKNAHMAQHTSRLDAPYTAKMWAVKADPGTPPEPRHIVITAQQLSRWAVVDLYVLPDASFASDANPNPVASLIATNQPVTLALRPDQTLYAISVNRCNYRTAEVTISASIGVRVEIQGERKMVLVLEADQTETTRKFEAMASPPGVYRFEWDFGDGTTHEETKQPGELSAVTHTYRESKPGDEHVLHVGLHSGTGDLLAEDTITLTMAAADASGAGGFWVLDESKRRPPGDRPGYTTVKLGEHEYEGKVAIKKDPYAYEATGWARWDTLPKVVPNGADWRMPVRARFDRKLTGQDPDVTVVQLPVNNDSAGFTLQMESTGTIYRPRSVEEKRGVSVAFIAGDGKLPLDMPGFAFFDPITRHHKEIEDSVSLAFPLLSPKVTNTPERPTITLSAWVADQRVTEKHAYRWSHELPKELEADLRRETGRANFLGARSWTKDMAAGAQASTVTLEAPASLAEGTTAVLSSLKHLPPLLQAGQEAAFEVDLKDGPATPTFSWYFGVGPPTQANAWTEARQTRFTYMKPGVYTVRVTVRDKTAYTRGLLAEGAWRVSVAPAAD